MLRYSGVKFKYFLFFILLVFTLPQGALAQLTVTPSSTAALLAAKLTGPGITIVSDTLTCNTQANGTFTSVSTPIAIDSGIILCTGKAIQASGTEPALTSTNFGGAGDADLLPYVGSTTTTYDACALIINFVPHGDTVSFRYQFGSEEYRQSTCGVYNDAFAFFISGPGVSASLPGVNMALVPGTTIPVAVNSVNSGIIGTTPGCNLSNCTSMGPGSPFTAYYINNAGGTTVSYRGYTDVFTAQHWVVPCDTYRIKMSIVDAGNGLYDSGVFIEAGSLKTNTYHFNRNDSIGYTVMGTPGTLVKGCRADTIQIVSAYPVAVPTTLNLNFSGTATAGVDYTTLPSTVTIPAGDTTAYIIINPLTTTPVGPLTLGIALSASSACGTIDSISLNILDHPAADIITPDTSICTGASVNIITTGTAGLTYSWSPAATLSGAAIAEPVATPTVTTSYTMSATLPGSGCPAIVDTISINVSSIIASILTPDTTVCEGDVFTLHVNGSSTYTYMWTPSNGLSDVTAQNPTLAADSSTTYVVTATLPGAGCSVSASVHVTVISLDFAINVHDTAICEGAILGLDPNVTPPSASYSYSWTGPNGYYSPLQNAVVTTSNPNFAGTYTVTVTNQGLCSKKGYETVLLYPTPSDQILYPAMNICQYSAALPVEIPHYNNLVWYPSPSDSTSTVFAPLPNTGILGIQQFWAAQINLQDNCIGPVQEIDVNVIPCCNGTLFVPDAFTPNNDGRNDELHVVNSQEYVINEFDIYNRWGNLVFHGSGANVSWDGTYNGQPCDIGSYYYTLTANCVNSEKPIYLKGDITLLR